MVSLRAFFGFAVVVTALGCSSGKPASPFEEKWASLKVDPAVIQSDSKGAGLVGEVRRATETEAPLAEVTGDVVGELSDSAAAGVVRHNVGGVKGCYAIAARDGAGSGKAILNLDIDMTGAVASVGVEAPAFEGTNLPTCMTNRAKNWQFPKFSEGPKHFSYPFVFAGN